MDDFVEGVMTVISSSGSVAMHRNVPDSKVHGAKMGPRWGRQEPGGPHVGPMNFAIWGMIDWEF